MQMRPFLVPVVGLAAVLLATVLVFAQPKATGPAPSQAAIEKAVLETNAKMTRVADSLNADGFFEYSADTDRIPVIQNGILLKTRHEGVSS